MKILAFAASNSKQSINKQLVSFAANRLASSTSNNSVELLDINDYEIPIYSIDREQNNGIPQLAHDFLAKIKSADLVMISFAEHNGNYSAAYKNLFDWCTRAEQKIFQDTDVILMATSPGGRGGKSVLEIASAATPRFGANVLGSFSLPSFGNNFDADKQEISNPELLKELDGILKMVYEFS
ncbi:MAG: NAD(P)H-dependent oxidoreductase [Saccharospirillaceae bacterium]|nr:NAD(P)H-dependent oxidoreductase [Pseudomonadales bacterium]NRB80072.1 NAD(P)H-dependent oxidoreductase [Saccharospirillaceae bacterium]